MDKWWLNQIFSVRVLREFYDRKFSHQLATTHQQSSPHRNKFGRVMQIPRKLLIVASSPLPHKLPESIT